MCSDASSCAAAPAPEPGAYNVSGNALTSDGTREGARCWPAATAAGHHTVKHRMWRNTH